MEYRSECDETMSSLACLVSGFLPVGAVRRVGRVVAGWAGECVGLVRRTVKWGAKE